MRWSDLENDVLQTREIAVSLLAALYMVMRDGAPMVMRYRSCLLGRLSVLPAA